MRAENPLKEPEFEKAARRQWEDYRGYLREWADKSAFGESFGESPMTYAEYERQRENRWQKS